MRPGKAIILFFCKKGEKRVDDGILGCRERDFKSQISDFRLRGLGFFWIFVLIIGYFASNLLGKVGSGISTRGGKQRTAAELDLVVGI